MQEGQQQETGAAENRGPRLVEVGNEVGQADSERAGSHGIGGKESDMRKQRHALRSLFAMINGTHAAHTGAAWLTGG